MMIFFSRLRICVTVFCFRGFFFFFFKQKTAYEMRISDWSSDVCSSDLLADDPAVHPLAVAGRIEAGLVAAFVHLAEARGVPDLGAEVAIALDAALGELDVAALRGQRREGEAHRVGAELVDEVERVQDVDRKSTRLNSSH